MLCAVSVGHVCTFISVTVIQPPNQPTVAKLQATITMKRTKWRCKHLTKSTWHRMRVRVKVEVRMRVRVQWRVRVSNWGEGGVTLPTTNT